MSNENHRKALLDMDDLAEAVEAALVCLGSAIPDDHEAMSAQCVSYLKTMLADGLRPHQMLFVSLFLSQCNLRAVSAYGKSLLDVEDMKAKL